MKMNKKGFTLVETLSCVVIISLLSLIISGLIRLFYRSNLIKNKNKTYSNDDEMIYMFLKDISEIKETISEFRIGDNNDIFIMNKNGSMYLKYLSNVYVNGIEYPFIYYEKEYLCDQLIITYTYDLNTYYLIIPGVKI